jgi:exonuclease VII large subunit
MQASDKISGFNQKLQGLDKDLSKMDPTPWLQRGWTRLQGKDGRIKSIKDLKMGDTITARLLDGAVEFETKKITPKGKKGK